MFNFTYLIQPTVASALTTFRNSEELDQILSSFNLLKHICGVEEGVTDVKRLQEQTRHGAFWCRNMWELFETKANHPCYTPNKSVPTPFADVMVVGGGPAGLVTAIELTLMGANVHVVERRTYITRNNILHLWPWTVHYLKSLNAKVFYSKFSTGGIEHVGTKQLQRILLKACLLLGIKVSYGIKFQGVEEVGNGKWRLNNHQQNGLHFQFNTIIGADGEHSKVVQYFEMPQKNTKGSLCLGITQNFDNLHTEEELTRPEFGVSKVFNPKFFGEMTEKYGVELENLVYYCGETHYFVMTATPRSLATRGVFLVQKEDISELIHTSNLCVDNLLGYVRDVATHCTLPSSCPVTKNHYGKPDVALFDFSNRHMSEEAARMVPSKEGSSSLLVSLVGDALLQPFWPMGTGVNRAILSALDTAWMMRELKEGVPVEEAITNRNKYYLFMKNALAGSIPRAFGKTNVEPKSRYGTGSSVGL
eukprot:TRINITY_DN2462_c0_g1_i7.p1 TRINITY_DN2462_c0_g1~~TRINITY_DN2462_c0_g1_i7.p1  ORF type:complete len:476 (+),score=69.86 TRINITY_DN2462_c0_g1_i7:606-2033(+)